MSTQDPITTSDPARRRDHADTPKSRGPSGVLEPLQSPSIRRSRATDQPFMEAKEVVGGYCMMQVKSKAEAIECASRCPASNNEIIEIRQVQESLPVRTASREKNCAECRFPQDSLD